MNQVQKVDQGLFMKKTLMIARLSLAGAIFAVSLVSVGASVMGYDSSMERDLVAALGGGAVTFGVLAKVVGLIA